MYIDCVFHMSHTLFKPSFELQSIFIGQLFLVIANGIHHGSKQFILFVASDIQGSKESYVKLFHNVIREVFSDQSGNCIFVFSGSCDLLVLQIEGFLSLTAFFTEVATRLNTCSVEAVEHYEPDE